MARLMEAFKTPEGGGASANWELLFPHKCVAEPKILSTISMTVLTI
jgi:hypothetical protein